MSVDYFLEEIHDELCGAKAYIKKAIECKINHQEWSSMLVDMSAAELSHANNLMKMFNDFYKNMTEKSKEIPEYITKAHEEAANMYAEKYAKVKMLHEAYNKL